MVFSPTHSSIVLADDSLTPGDNTNGTNGNASGNGESPTLDPDKIKAPELGGGDPANWAIIIKKFISWLLVAAGVIAVISLIFAGYIYMTSSGDPEKAKIGKNAVVGAVIGLVITFIAYAIILFISDTVLK